MCKKKEYNRSNFTIEKGDMVNVHFVDGGQIKRAIVIYMPCSPGDDWIIQDQNLDVHYIQQYRSIMLSGKAAKIPGRHYAEPEPCGETATLEVDGKDVEWTCSLPKGHDGMHEHATGGRVMVQWAATVLSEQPEPEPTAFHKAEAEFAKDVVDVMCVGEEKGHALRGFRVGWNMRGEVSDMEKEEPEPTGFDKAWADYCEFFNLSEDTQEMKSRMKCMYSAGAKDERVRLIGEIGKWIADNNYWISPRAKHLQDFLDELKEVAG